MADGGDNEPEEDVVRRQVILTVRCVMDFPVHFDEGDMHAFIANMCKSDLIMSLAEQIAYDDEKGACNVCSHAEAVLVPVSEEVQCLWLDNLPEPVARASFGDEGGDEEEAEDAEEVDEEDDEDLDTDDEEDDGEP